MLVMQFSIIFFIIYGAICIYYENTFDNIKNYRKAIFLLPFLVTSINIFGNLRLIYIDLIVSIILTIYIIYLIKNKGFK
jgi:hypothetical protein